LLKLLQFDGCEEEEKGKESGTQDQKRIAVPFEGRPGMGFGWRAAQSHAAHTKAHVIHASSCSTSYRVNPARKTDRLTPRLTRAFLGWMRGRTVIMQMGRKFPDNRGMKMPRDQPRARESLAGEQTRIVQNRMKAALSGSASAASSQLKKGRRSRLEDLRTPRMSQIPPTRWAAMRRELLERRRLVRSQIRDIRGDGAWGVRGGKPPGAGPPRNGGWWARVSGLASRTPEVGCRRCCAKLARPSGGGGDAMGASRLR